MKKRLLGKPAPSGAYSVVRPRPRGRHPNLGKKNFITRVPALGIRQARNPRQTLNSSAFQGRYQATPRSCKADKILWWQCPYTAQMFTGPSEHVRPDLQRTKRLNQVHGISKPPNLRGAASLTHAASMEEAAKTSYEQRRALVYEKFVAATWPGAHEIACKPTSWHQSVNKQGKTTQTACHKCRKCGMEVFRSRMPYFICTHAKHTKKPPELSERLKLWKQWRQEPQFPSAAKKVRSDNSQQDKSKGPRKRPAAFCSA